MSDRLVKTLVGALVLLILAWLAARFIVQRGAETRSGSFQLAAAADAIDSIVVTTSGDTVRLRAGEPWTVNGYEALPETGYSLQQALQEAQVGQRVSRNPENHPRMGVSDDEGRRFTVYSGDGARVTLIVGGRAGAFDEYYVRRAGDDDVYIVKGSLVNLANRGADDWRDREIFSAERTSVQRLEYAYPDETFALVRDSAAWRLAPSGAEAEIGTVSTLLSQLTALRAIGFAADSASAALNWEEAAPRLRVVGPEGAELGQLLFLENPDVGYFVRRAGSPVVYTLSSYTGDQIVVRPADLAAGSAE
ncbi:MAG TPA: DUF4340 domain-containing protein [Gemmatimonadota bacterium]|nr:DUF4340 domain-containing protein [Gemmatimonadota bacterium]